MWSACGILSVCPTLALSQTDTQQPAIEDAHLSPTLYFASATSELESRQALHSQIKPLVDEITQADSASLMKVLDKAWVTIAALQRHAAYLKIKSLEDTQDQIARTAQQSVSADRSALRSAIDSRLQQVPASQIAALGSYAFLATDIQRDAKHLLSPDKESYRHAVVLPHEDTLKDAGEAFVTTLSSAGNKKDLSSLDFATRRAALKTREETYDAAAPSAATLLATLVDIDNKDAIAQGYANAADRKYDSLGLSSKIVDRTLQAVSAEAPAYKDYEALVAQHAAKKLGVPSILSSEQDISRTKPQPISLTEAKKLILGALTPLGPDYARRFAQLLDPANGRFDLSGGSHRDRTGTSIEGSDGPVALYYDGYDGSLKGVAIIAHEGGHAIHNELMIASGIPIYERTSPHFLAEGIADFNELMTLDYATRVAQTHAEREYALERLLAYISYELFGSAEEGTMERSLYTKAIGHALLDRPEIDTIYQDSIRPYEYWPMSDIGTSRNWMRKALLYEDPLYLVNYLYAAVVAVALYDKAHSDPSFPAEYEAFLSRGEYADPQTMLLSIGIRLDDPAIIRPVVKLFREKTQALRTLYLSESK